MESYSLLYCFQSSDVLQSIGEEMELKFRMSNIADVGAARA